MEGWGGVGGTVSATAGSLSGSWKVDGSIPGLESFECIEESPSKTSNPPIAPDELIGALRGILSTLASEHVRTAGE